MMIEGVKGREKNVSERNGEGERETERNRERWKKVEKKMEGKKEKERVRVMDGWKVVWVKCLLLLPIAT